MDMSKLSRLQCKAAIVTKESEKSLPDADFKKISSNTTPISRKSVKRDDYEDDRLSPYSMRFTQDSADDELDVIWDWDSPRSKGSRCLHKKRILHSSPKIPKKQISYNKDLPRFHALKAELEELATRLNEPYIDNSNNQSYLVIEDDSIFLKPEVPESVVSTKDNSDLFDDDSMDEEMIKCSQQIEDAFFVNDFSVNVTNNKDLSQPDNRNLVQNAIDDDSFDVFLEEMNDEQIERLSQASGSSGTKSPQSAVHGTSKIIQSPRAIARTNSVPSNFPFNKKPSCTVTSSNIFPRTKSEDFYNVIKKSTEVNKIRCSPEEIEKKRQEAKTKLEWRKKQNEIEKKRSEALERLKRNRMLRLLSSQNGANGKRL